MISYELLYDVIPYYNTCLLCLLKKEICWWMASFKKRLKYIKITIHSFSCTQELLSTRTAGFPNEWPWMAGGTLWLWMALGATQTSAEQRESALLLCPWRLFSVLRTRSNHALHRLRIILSQKAAGRNCKTARGDTASQFWDVWSMYQIYPNINTYKEVLNYITVYLSPLLGWKPRV